MSAFVEYQSRCEEIERLLKWLQLQTSPAGLSQKEVEKFVSPEIDPTLKASVFLMLYNLVEGTASAAIAAILDAIECSGEALADFSRELQILALSNISRVDSSDTWHAESVSNPNGGDIVRMAVVKRRKYFSGNLDLKELSKIFQRFGVSIEMSGFDSDVKYAFETVRSKRNLLAHGEVSFSNVGRNMTISELRGFFEKIREALNHLVDEVTLYLSSRAYISKGST